MSNGKKVLQLRDSLKTDRSQWDTLWDAVDRYVLPRKTIDGSSSANQPSKGKRAYDGTAVYANNLLAAALHGYLTSPDKDWFGFVPRRADRKAFSNSKKAIGEYISSVEDVVYDIINDTRSGFTENVHEFMLQLTSYGTAVMLVEELPTPGGKGSPVRFKTISVTDCYMQENERDQIDTVIRESEFPTKKLVQTFGDSVPEAVKKKANGETVVRHKVIHAVMPRDIAEKHYDIKVDKDSNIKFASVYVLEEEKVVLKSSGYEKFPYMVARWSVLANDVYGTSPAMNCMADILTVNAMGKTILKSARKKVDPLLMLPDEGFLLPTQGVNSSVSTKPDSILWFRSGTTDRPEYLESRADIPIGLEMENQRRAFIETCFYVDWLRLREGPEMTATEVMQRVDDRMRMMSPMTGRIQNEFNSMLLRRILSIAGNKSMLPEPVSIGDKLYSYDEFDLRFETPIEMARKIGRVMSSNRAIESLMAVAGVDRTVLDALDLDKYARFILDGYGFPADIVRSEQEINDIRQSRQEAMQQEQELKQAQVSRDQSAALANTAKASKDLRQVP